MTQRQTTRFRAFARGILWVVVLTLALVAVLASLSCAAPLEPDPVDLGGYYTTFLRLEGRERWSGDSTAWVALRCEGGVALVLADGDGILQGGFTRGDLACWFGLEPDPRPIPWASPVAGERRGAQVTLDDGYCRYTATLDAQVAHRVAGDVVCDSDSGATVLDLTGTWEATR